MILAIYVPTLEPLNILPFPVSKRTICTKMGNPTFTLHGIGHLHATNA